MRAIPLALSVALALLAACGDDDSAGEAAPAQVEPCTRTVRAGDSVIRLRHDRLTRSARVHVPRGVPRTHRLPVLVVLHFAGGPARSMEALTRFTPLADRERFVAVYPEAAGRRHFWTLTTDTPSKPDDVAFLRALLDRLERDGCTDPDRVYATGVSNGGGMAVRLACSLSDRVAAIAPVAGGYSTFEGDCEPTEPVAVLEIHGTGDRITPYRGREGGRGSVSRLLRLWAARNGCPPVPFTRETFRGGVDRWDWAAPPCAPDGLMRHVRIARFGHGWPGGTRGPVQGRGSDYPATREVWRFFERLRRR